jgi:hypothetical protein
MKKNPGIAVVSLLLFLGACSGQPGDVSADAEVDELDAQVGSASVSSDAAPMPPPELVPCVDDYGKMALCPKESGYKGLASDLYSAKKSSEPVYVGVISGTAPGIASGTEPGLEEWILTASYVDVTINAVTLISASSPVKTEVRTFDSACVEWVPVVPEPKWGPPSPWCPGDSALWGASVGDLFLIREWQPSHGQAVQAWPMTAQGLSPEASGLDHWMTVEEIKAYYESL